MRTTRTFSRTAYLKDPKDPEWKNDPAMNEWRAFMTKWYPEGDQDDASTVFAYGVAKGLEQVLRQCGDDLTRENVMKQAANLNFEIGIYLPGTKIKTSPTDFAPIEQLQMQRFKGESLGALRADDVGREEFVRVQEPSPARRGRCSGDARQRLRDRGSVVRGATVRLCATRRFVSLARPSQRRRKRNTTMKITDVRAHHIRIPYDAGAASFRQGASAISALDMVVVEVIDRCRPHRLGRRLRLCLPTHDLHRGRRR